MTREGVLSEKTLMPIGFVVVLLGGVIWLTNIHFEAHANSVAIDEIQKKQDVYAKGQEEVLERLARIEGKLEGLRRWTSRNGE